MNHAKLKIDLPASVAVRLEATARGLRLAPGEAAGFILANRVMATAGVFRAPAGKRNPRGGAREGDRAASGAALSARVGAARGAAGCRGGVRTAGRGGRRGNAAAKRRAVA